MKNYLCTYEKEGLSYQVENYRFCYDGIDAAEIELIIDSGDKTSFNYKIIKNKKYWADLPPNYYEGSSSFQELYKEFKMNSLGMFDCKEQALGNAIHILEKILSKYRTLGV